MAAFERGEERRETGAPSPRSPPPPPASPSFWRAEPEEQAAIAAERFAPEAAPLRSGTALSRNEPAPSRNVVAFAARSIKVTIAVDPAQLLALSPPTGDRMQVSIEVAGRRINASLKAKSLRKSRAASAGPKCSTSWGPTTLGGLPKSRTG
jgi:hypothetical protein